MALDANGVPIPVFVPPPPPPPRSMKDLGLATGIGPDLENDVGLLRGAIEELSKRLAAVEKFAPRVGKMESRVDALETVAETVGGISSRFGVVEEAYEGLPKLLERIVELENARITMQARIDSLEQHVQETEHVHPVPPA